MIVILVGASACHDATPRKPAALSGPRAATGLLGRPPSQRPRHRTVLIQVDGLPGAWVARWLRERRFLPDQPPAPQNEWSSGGLYRLAAGAHSFQLRPVDPSLTAPNLATQLTGAWPKAHGILSNRFFRQGRRVAGFGQPLQAPPLWKTALAKGRRVVTWLALGTRCEPPAPRGLRAVCFPRGQVSRPRSTVVVDTRQGGKKQGGHLTLVAALGAPGRHRLSVGVTRSAPGRVTLRLPAGARLLGKAGADLAPGDARGILWPGGRDAAGLPAPRRLSFVSLRALNRATGKAVFHIAGTAVNRASPPAFSRTLDALGLIRPPGADKHGLRDGRISPRLFARAAIREVAQAARFAAWLGRGDRFDLAVIYVAAVDTLGHALYAPSTRPELEPREVHAFHRALERALRQVDRHLAAMVQGLDPQRTRIVLASDHGLSPVGVDVSLRAALFDLDPRIRVVTSGASGFVRLPEGVSAAEVEQRLRGLRVHGTPVFADGRIVARKGFAALGLPPEAGDLFVQAGPGFTLSARRRKTLTDWPRLMATHGHRSDLPALQATLLLIGPGLRRHGDLGPLRMTQVAGLVDRAAGLTPPRHAAPAPSVWTE